MTTESKTTHPHALDVLAAVRRFLEMIDEARAMDPEAWDDALNCQAEAQNDLYSQAFALLEPFRR